MATTTRIQGAMVFRAVMERQGSGESAGVQAGGGGVMGELRTGHWQGGVGGGGRGKGRGTGRERGGKRAEEREKGGEVGSRTFPAPRGHAPRAAIIQFTEGPTSRKDASCPRGPGRSL